MPNDFQPRANIKKMFSDGMLTTEEELQQFLEKFAVEPHLIKAYIAHLEDLKIQSGIRTRGRAEQKRKMMSKTFEEYAWRDLVESGDLKKLLVSELNKYLKHYKLVSSGTKAEKIRRISLHVLVGNHGQQEDTNELTDEETKECGNIFNANKCNVDNHLKAVYSKTSRSKVIIIHLSSLLIFSRKYG